MTPCTLQQWTRSFPQSFLLSMPTPGYVFNCFPPAGFHPRERRAWCSRYIAWMQHVYFFCDWHVHVYIYSLEYKMRCCMFVTATVNSPPCAVEVSKSQCSPESPPAAATGASEHTGTASINNIIHTQILSTATTISCLSSSMILQYTAISACMLPTPYAVTRVAYDADMGSLA